MIKIKNNKGFTLVEVLIVVLIIGILATLLMVNFVGVRQRARDAERKSDLRQIQSALELYRADNGSYPNAPLPGCGESLIDSIEGTNVYIKIMPCDPLDNTIIYTYDIPAVGGYSLTACLENAKDSQKDVENTCATGYYSYTLYNP